MTNSPAPADLEDLGARLWAAANRLRGPVDPADFKGYVFPILFFRWISDTWDLERACAVADFGDEVAAEIEADCHRFVVPDGCHWTDVRNRTANVGVELQKALDRLQQANPDTVAGIFGDVAWGNKEGIPAANLLHLTDSFDTLTLNPDVVSNDLLGAASDDEACAADILSILRMVAAGRPRPPVRLVMASWWVGPRVRPVVTMRRRGAAVRSGSWPHSPAAIEASLQAQGSGRQPQLVTEHLTLVGDLVAQLLARVDDLTPRQTVEELHAGHRFAVITPAEDALLKATGLEQRMPATWTPGGDPWTRYWAAGLDPPTFAPLPGAS